MPSIVVSSIGSVGGRNAVGKRFARGPRSIALALFALAIPQMTSAATSTHGALADKFAYCQDCHGANGQGFRGYYPIPRLGGQQVQYIENQLRAFIEHRRRNAIMLNVAHGLQPGMTAALAERFNRLNPRPIGGAPRALAAKGKEIFEAGIPQANVAACAACHGPGATGKGEIPRLAGQLYEYVVAKLTNWNKERGQIPSRPDTSLIMEPVAHSLTRSEAQAVAAYVSTLR
jgi:cytochrome c553